MGSVWLLGYSWQLPWWCHLVSCRFQPWRKIPGIYMYCKILDKNAFPSWHTMHFIRPQSHQLANFMCKIFSVLGIQVKCCCKYKINVLSTACPSLSTIYIQKLAGWQMLLIYSLQSNAQFLWGYWNWCHGHFLKTKEVSFLGSWEADRIGSCPSTKQ